jgi:GTP diphosphokinase / guanosine-3',5'-bis(diphosphate) 3'-diphosphatase
MSARAESLPRTKASASRPGARAGARANKALPEGFIDIDDLVEEHERDPQQRAYIEAGRKLVAERYPEHIRGLAALRMKRGWSQRTLADAIGVKQPHIARLELGHNDPSLSTMRKLATALGVSVEHIAHELESQRDGQRTESAPESFADSAGLVLKATEFAAHKHRDQRRKDAGASPYINHPIALANVLCNEGGITDPMILAAALLHDTLEDTETDYEELRGQFGDDIADVVVEVTDTKWLSKEARKRLQVSKASHSSARARAVKIADKICNLRDILGSPPANWSLQRKQKYFDWAKQVVDGVRGAYPELEQRFDALYRQRPMV